MFYARSGSENKAQEQMVSSHNHIRYKGTFQAEEFTEFDDIV